MQRLRWWSQRAREGVAPKSPSSSPAQTLSFHPLVRRRGELPLPWLKAGPGGELVARPFFPAGREDLLGLLFGAVRLRCLIQIDLEQIATGRHFVIIILVDQLVTMMIRLL
uniref:Uncharacterized protein n=1 Tax=Oryza brachyantha TaxID=4533 RepID=J3MGJ7_ORYBR